MLGFLLILFLQAPNPILSRVGVDQKLGSPVDSSIVVHDEDGHNIRLGDLFRNRPVLLTPVYYECPMLCSVQLNSLVRALKVMPMVPAKDFDIITFSIDPRETPEVARSRKQHYVRDYGKAGADTAWHFLTADAESIKRLTDSIGFRYTVDPSTGQFAHVSTLLTLMPDGRISQYFYGLEYDPADLKASLRRASEGKVGSLVQQALLYCYKYDPSTGRYSLSILRIVRVGGIATILGLFGVAGWAARQRKRA
jgi:protein SCO1